MAKKGKHTLILIGEDSKGGTNEVRVCFQMSYTKTSSVDTAENMEIARHGVR